MGMGKSVINDGTVMHDNVAMNGGCISEHTVHRSAFLSEGIVHSL